MAAHYLRLKDLERMVAVALDHMIANHTRVGDGGGGAVVGGGG